MRYSKLFTKTLHEAPSDVDNISSKLLVQADFIDKLSAGVYSFLPLGFRVQRRIENIIRDEMDALGGMEILMPAVQPKSLWMETGRWEKMDPPLFVFKNRHKKEFALGPTHEEVVTKIVRERVKSYKDLPFMIYQIQNKFRNEIRFTGGLLRVLEFIMKDAYSFHKNEEEMSEFYEKINKAYKKIFSRCGLQVVATKAHSGSIGGERSHEFMTICETGEDRIIICQSCDFAVSVEAWAGDKDKKKCPGCGGIIKEVSAIESGHAFDLGTLYSKKMGANFVDEDGKEKPFIMGCYGIGVGRLLATIVEAHHDKSGMIWPGEVAPFQVHMVYLGDDKKVKDEAEKVYQKLIDGKIEVLYDDREKSAGEKLADADLLGIPWRAVVSERTIKENKIELKNRSEKEVKLVSLEELLKSL